MRLALFLLLLVCLLSACSTSSFESDQNGPFKETSSLPFSEGTNTEASKLSVDKRHLLYRGSYSQKTATGWQQQEIAELAGKAYRIDGMSDDGSRLLLQVVQTETDTAELIIATRDGSSWQLETLLTLPLGCPSCPLEVQLSGNGMTLLVIAEQIDIYEKQTTGWQKLDSLSKDNSRFNTVSMSSSAERILVGTVLYQRDGNTWQVSATPSNSFFSQLSQDGNHATNGSALFKFENESWTQVASFEKGSNFDQTWVIAMSHDASTVMVSYQKIAKPPFGLDAPIYQPLVSVYSLEAGSYRQIAQFVYILEGLLSPDGQLLAVPGDTGLRIYERD